MTAFERLADNIVFRHHLCRRLVKTKRRAAVKDGRKADPLKGLRIPHPAARRNCWNAGLRWRWHSPVPSSCTETGRCRKYRAFNSSAQIADRPKRCCSSSVSLICAMRGSSRCLPWLDLRIRCTVPRPAIWPNTAHAVCRGAPLSQRLSPR